MPGSQSMHIAFIASRQGGRVHISKLLRQSCRKDGKVQKRTLANLSHLDDTAIALIQGHLRGKTFVEASGGGVEILASRSHGAVAAVKGAFHELGFQNLISSRPSRQRDLVCAMVAGRIIRPHTELATTRWWHTSTLARTFGVDDASVDELYQAMDWLLQRQNRIQGKLGRRLFREDGRVLYDLSSTYVEGEHCPLARRGHNRDGKKGKLPVNFGLLSDVRGRPAAVSVHPGNTGDTRTILPEVERLQKRFGLARVVLVGDRGMIVQTTIDALRLLDGLDWISALKGASVARLMRRGALEGLDAVNLFELFHPDFPGERLVRRRARIWQSMLEAT
ncbi:MAG: transposase [Rhodospirillaceae bacterium]|nr:transposase [Rhodospirillaceae bacterium]